MGHVGASGGQDRSAGRCRCLRGSVLVSQGSARSRARARVLLRASAGHRIERGLRRRDSGGEVVGGDWEVCCRDGGRRELDLLLDARDVVLVVLEGISFERPSASASVQVLGGQLGQRMAAVILLHMTQHGRLEGKLFVAARMRARVRLLLRVGLQVSVEISLLSEALLAEVAGVRFFAGVKSHVGDQIALLTEPLVAHLTRVGAVRLEMLFERQLFLKLDLAHTTIQIWRSPLGAAAITAAAHALASSSSAAAATLVSGSVIA